MAKKNDDVFDGFTLGDLSGVLSHTEDSTLPKGTGDNIPVIDPKELEELLDSKDDKTIVDDPEDDSSELEDKDGKDDKDIEEDKDKEDKDKKDEDQDDKDQDDKNEDEDLSEYEADISKFFVGKLADELGWSLGDNEKFDSVSDVIDYMQELVEESSKPNFANDEVAKFNEFVRDGGTLRKFYEGVVHGTLDLEDFDLEVDENKRAIVREDNRNQGYSEKQIIRKIERYENAGTLEEEAEDSKDNVEKFREKSAEKLLKDQQKFAIESEKQQQKFFGDVQSYVKTLKDIRGISISEVEKKKLLGDIFKADQSGQTQYQKIYSENFAKNLVESAYFTLMGDTITEKIRKREQTNAAKDLKRKLKTSKSKRTKGKVEDQDTTVSGGLGFLSNQLL